MAFKYADTYSSTIATIAGGTGVTSFTVTSATGFPVLATGDFTVMRINDAGGAGVAEDVICTGISGTTVTCLATAIAHAAGNTIDGAILSTTALNYFKDDAISGYPETAHTGAGALVITGGVTNKITLTSADATMTLANGTYVGQLCRIRMTNACTKLAAIDPASTTTIDGALTRIMWAGETALLSWDGTEWTKIAGKTIPMQCKIYRNAALNLADVTEEVVALETTSFDNTGLMATLASNGITIKRPGSYSARGCVAIAATGATTLPRFISEIIVGSTIVGYAETEKASAVSVQPAQIVVTDLSGLAAADLLKLRGFQSSGGARALNVGQTYYCFLSVTEVPSW